MMWNFPWLLRTGVLTFAQRQPKTSQERAVIILAGGVHE